MRPPAARRFERSPHLVALIAEVERLAARVGGAPADARQQLSDSRQLEAVHATLALDGATPDTLPSPARAREIVADTLAETLTDAAATAPAAGVDPRDRRGSWLDTLRVVEEGVDTTIAALELLGALAADDSDDLTDTVFADPGATLTELHRRLTRGLVAPERAGAPRLHDQAVHDGATGRIVHLTTPPVDLPRELALLTAWLTGEGAREHGVVTSGVLHLELLRLHPFDAANGRLARAAARVVLRARGLDPDHLAVPEPALAADPLGVAEEVARTLRRRDLTVWLERWAEAVADGLRGSARALGVLDAAPLPAARDFVAAHPRCTIAEYRAALGAEPEQARGQLLELLDAGMIRRVPGSRGLRFEHLLAPPADLD